MEWKKSKITRHVWEAHGFRITEDDNETFRLESPHAPEPQWFPSVEIAKTVAELQNRLAVTEMDNERLRAELTRIQNDGTWDRHPQPEDFEKPMDLVEIMPEREIAITVPHESAQDDDEVYDAAVRAFEEAQQQEHDDGRGIPLKFNGTPRFTEAKAGEAPF